jgi:hypothetical protein
MPYTPSLIITPDINAKRDWARQDGRGSQTCNGMTPAFDPKPSASRTKSSCGGWIEVRRRRTPIGEIHGPGGAR